MLSDQETTVAIMITEVAGTAYCVDPADGEKVYHVLKTELAAGRRVTLSFRGVVDLTSGFLNAAYGRLFGEHERASIEDHVAVTDIDEHHRSTLNRTAERAVRYFADPARFAQAERAALERDAA